MDTPAKMIVFLNKENNCESRAGGEPNNHFAEPTGAGGVVSGRQAQAVAACGARLMSTRPAARSGSELTGPARETARDPTQAPAGPDATKV